MADNLVLKVTVRIFAFNKIIREPQEGFERGSMSSDLGLIRIPLVVLRRGLGMRSAGKE